MTKGQKVEKDEPKPLTKLEQAFSRATVDYNGKEETLGVWMTMKEWNQVIVEIRHLESSPTFKTMMETVKAQIEALTRFKPGKNDAMEIHSRGNYIKRLSVLKLLDAANPPRREKEE